MVLLNRTLCCHNSVCGASQISYSGRYEFGTLHSEDADRCCRHVSSVTLVSKSWLGSADHDDRRRAL